MQLGIMLGDQPGSTPPRRQLDAVLRQAEAARRGGFTHLFIGQHFLWDGGSRWLQPIPVLARVAAEVGTAMRLATQIVLAPLYGPAVLAEELATLDLVTGGQLDVGFGVGYREVEYAGAGVPFEERFSRFEETVELVRALWTEERVDFHGRHFTLEGAHGQVRPLQRPHPPIWIGAQSDGAIRRAARLGDGWPITPQVPNAKLAEKIGIFAAERERLGKPIGLQPLRREIVIGADREDARARAIELARPFYLEMAALGAGGVDPAEVTASMHEIVERSFVIGSVEEVAAELRAIAARAPVGPIVTRGNWPGMEVEDMVDHIDTLGRELVPLLPEEHPTDAAVGA